MKITNMKRVVAACAATVAFMGLQNSTVEAITENRVVVPQENIWHPAILELNNDIKELNQNIIELNNDTNEVKQDTNDQGVELMTVSDKLKVKEMEMEKVEEQAAAQQAQEAAEEVTTAEPVEEPSDAITISNGEKDLFARLVEAEAKGESYEGKVAVATVILNRVESPEFPDTVTGVINEVVGSAYAFTPVQNGKINNPASDEAKQAVDEALSNSEDLDGSVYFYNPKIATDNWIRSREVVETIGNHVFAK